MKQLLNQRTHSSTLIQIKMNEMPNRPLEIYSIVVKNVMIKILQLYCFGKL